MIKKIVAILFLLITPILWADTIYLKDGSQIKGEILKSDKEKVIVKTSYGKIEIQKDKVDKIIFKDTQERKRKNEDYDDEGSEEGEVESWYMSFTFGYPVYKDLKEDLQGIDYEHISFNYYMDFYIYGTVNRNLIIGGGFSGVSFIMENYYGEDTLLIGIIIDLNLKYFFNRICYGPFIEAGVGFGSISIRDRGSNTRETKPEIGYALKGSIGYAAELNPYESALIFGLNCLYIYSDYNYETYYGEYKYTGSILTLSIYAGFLW